MSTTFAAAAARWPNPGLDMLVEQTAASGTLHASTSYPSALDGADVSLVCVGTPSTARGATDLFYVRRAVDDIVGAIQLVTPPPSGHHSVIIRSTVPPGTVEEVVIPALVHGLEPSTALNGADVAVVSSTDPAVCAALLAAPPRRLLDLSGRLGYEVESLPGYEGIGW
jgi:UDP-glucose 6-dehydrogenase